MPVPYNFNNSTLNSRRKQSWFARYRVLVVFGAVALVTLIIVLCITNCSSESSDTAKSTAGTAGAGAAVESEPRSDSAPDVSGDSGNSGKVEEAPRQPEITDWDKKRRYAAPHRPPPQRLRTGRDQTQLSYRPQCHPHRSETADHPRSVASCH